MQSPEPMQRQSPARPHGEQADALSVVTDELSVVTPTVGSPLESANVSERRLLPPPIAVSTIVFAVGQAPSSRMGQESAEREAAEPNAFVTLDLYDSYLEPAETA